MKKSTYDDITRVIKGKTTLYVFALKPASIADIDAIIKKRDIPDLIFNFLKIVGINDAALNKPKVGVMIKGEFKNIPYQVSNKVIKFSYKKEYNINFNSLGNVLKDIADSNKDFTKAKKEIESLLKAYK